MQSYKVKDRFWFYYSDIKITKYLKQNTFIEEKHTTFMKANIFLFPDNGESSIN
jgi:hypothetical protein